MITQVELKNFQSHQHTVIDLVNGVNVIIGPSDAGKSAVFRAINWVVSNRPLGDAYRSDWGGDTSVTLTTDAGQVITRLRTDKQNAYIVNGVTLAAFGTEPPADVFEALAIDANNVQSQADPPFLLAASPGEVAAALNRAASIDDIDVAMGGLRRGALALTRDLTYNQGQLTEYQAQLAAYDYLPQAEKAVTKAEAAAVDLTAARDNYATLDKLIVQIHKVQLRLAVTQRYVGAEAALAAALEAQSEYTQLTERYESCARLLRQARKAEAALAQAQNVTAVEPIVKQAQSARDMLRDTGAQGAALARLMKRVRQLQTEITTADGAVDTLLEEYAALAPTTCPLCGNPMTTEAHPHE